MAIFEHAVAVVTGGGSGIGKSIAAGLIARGVKVAIGDISGDAAKSAAAELGEGTRGYACDVTDRNALDGLAEKAQADLGHITLVFANAGVCISGSLLDTDPKEFDWLIDVNVKGVFATIQTFAPLLIANAAGGRQTHLTITGSENSLGVPPVGPASAYTMTKHAILGLADTARRDLAETGVGVSILCPGMVDTQLYNSRNHRQGAYGGASALPPEDLQMAKQFMAQGQDPELTAALCLQGMENGEFMIIADPTIRNFAEKRNREVEAALDTLDGRLR